MNNRPGWKGENVSTNEVAEAMSSYPGIQEANVYGVEIPGKVGSEQHCGARQAPSYASTAFIFCLVAPCRTAVLAWRR